MTFSLLGCCQHHPGVPVFHDAMKKWSCCDKKSYDFTECLQLPVCHLNNKIILHNCIYKIQLYRHLLFYYSQGCTFGIHSNEKPPPQPKAEPYSLPEESIVRGPPPKPAQTYVRPSKDEKMRPLNTTITDSLAKELEKKMVNETEVEPLAPGQFHHYHG